LEARRAELRFRLGLAPAPETGSGGDEADAIVARETRTLHFANAAQMRASLAAIDEALDRLHAGKYGACSPCDEPTPPARLRAIPEAARCVGCQVAHEQQRGAIEQQPRYQPRPRVSEEAGDNDGGLQRRELAPADEDISDLKEII